MEKQRKRKKRTVYEEYDYESSYQEDAERLEEQQMLELIKEGRHQVYATKEIRAGEQLEVEVYPEFTRKQRDMIPDEGKKKKQREAQRNLNEKNSRKQCERVINANFTDRDIWATFTYDDENVPETMEEAQQNMQKYIKRLNYRRKKAGLENARYVYVTECSKKGRWHHHIVIDGDMDMDTVEKLWTAGKRNEVRRLKKDKNGLTAMAQYITKSPNDKGSKKDERKGQKKWTPSKGLKKPQEKVTHYKIKAKDVNNIVKNADELPEVLKKWYGEQGYNYTSGEAKYNDYNGRFYIYARMWKEPEEESSETAKKKTTRQKNSNRTDNSRSGSVKRKGNKQHKSKCDTGNTNKATSNKRVARTNNDKRKRTNV